MAGCSSSEKRENDLIRVFTRTSVDYRRLWSDQLNDSLHRPQALAFIAHFMCTLMHPSVTPVTKILFKVTTSHRSDAPFAVLTDVYHTLLYVVQQVTHNDVAIK